MIDRLYCTQLFCFTLALISSGCAPTSNPAKCRVTVDKVTTDAAVYTCWQSHDYYSGDVKFELSDDKSTVVLDSYYDSDLRGGGHKVFPQTAGGLKPGTFYTLSYTITGGLKEPDNPPNCTASIKFSTQGTASSPSAPQVATTCSAGQYIDSNGNVCVNVGLGYYSIGGTKNRLTCTNAPGNAAYSDPAATSPSCPYNCNLGFTSADCHKIENAGPTLTCAAGSYSADGVLCTAVGKGYYSLGNDVVRSSCTNAPAHGVYTSPNSTSPTCPWSCDTGYVNQTGSSCTAFANAQILSCPAGSLAVGVIGQAGWVVDRLGVHCQNFSTGVLSGPVTSGASYGGFGGTAFNNDSAYDCPVGYALKGVTGFAANFAGHNQTGAFSYTCVKVDNLTVTSTGPTGWTGGSSSATCRQAGSTLDVTHNFGSCDNNGAFNFTCGSAVNSNATFVNALIIDSAASGGAYSGPIIGISCQ